MWNDFGVESFSWAAISAWIRVGIGNRARKIWLRKKKESKKHKKKKTHTHTYRVSAVCVVQHGTRRETLGVRLLSPFAVGVRDHRLPYPRTRLYSYTFLYISERRLSHMAKHRCLIIIQRQPNSFAMIINNGRLPCQVIRATISQEGRTNVRV